MPAPPIAIADDAALPACLALLPMLAAEDALILAARDPDGTLAGAGGLLWRAWGDPAGFPAWVHILPDRRGQGIGRALVEALAEIARGETDALIAATPIAQDGTAARFAAALGATAGQGHHYFEMHTPIFQTAMIALIARLAASGRIPAATRVESLDADNVAGVIALVSANFAVAPPAAEALLARALIEDPATAPIDRRRSCVARIGDAVAGVLVARRTPGTAATDIMFRVIAPAWRGGWINALLMERFLAHLAADGGGEHVTFDCIDSNRDTLALAVRSAARTLRVDRVWRYAVARAAR